MQQHGAVAGWVTHNRGSGVIVTSAADKKATLTPRLDFGILRQNPGTETPGETFVLGWFDDAREGLEHYGDLINRIHQIKLPARPPAGLCVWYMDPHGMLGFSGKDLAALRDVAAKELKPFGFEFLMIDDGWQLGNCPPGEFGPVEVFTMLGSQCSRNEPSGTGTERVRVPDIGDPSNDAETIVYLFKLSGIVFIQGGENHLPADAWLRQGIAAGFTPHVRMSLGQFQGERSLRAVLQEMKPLFWLPLHEYEMTHDRGGNRTGQLLQGGKLL
jgi:hypothetical protein